MNFVESLKLLVIQIQNLGWLIYQKDITKLCQVETELALEEKKVYGKFKVRYGTLLFLSVFVHH